MARDFLYFNIELVDPNSHGKTLVTRRISAKTCLDLWDLWAKMGQVTRVLWDCPPSRSRIRLIFPRCCAKRKLSWDHSDDGNFNLADLWNQILCKGLTLTEDVMRHICIHMYTYYIYIYIYIHTRIYIIYLYIYTHIYIYIYMTNSMIFGCV